MPSRPSRSPTSPTWSLQAISRTTRSFAQDVEAGLASRPRTLPCKYFYDEQGSALFEAITDLPEYYPTRTELALMQDRALDMARAIGPGALVIELGSGTSRKTRLLLAALERPAGYVPVDISSRHLHASAKRLALEQPDLEIRPVAADFTSGFDLPEVWSRPPRRVVVYFPGSTIGNFPTEQARRLLMAIGELLVPWGDRQPGALLLGFDRVKDTSVLERAYDDSSGVTAAFNRNLLVRINREIGADFVPEAFSHRATWCEEQARIEMHLVSTERQVVHIRDRPLLFDRGEGILTEYSHKYTEATMLELARAAGLHRGRLWSDHDDQFSIGLFER